RTHDHARGRPDHGGRGVPALPPGLERARGDVTMRLFYFREAWRSFTHHRGLATTAILALTAALTVAGVFVLFAHNARTALRLVGDRREMVVYLKDEVSRDQRDAMVQRLQRLYGDVTYVSREQAWQEFSEEV